MLSQSRRRDEGLGHREGKQLQGHPAFCDATPTAFSIVPQPLPLAKTFNNEENVCQPIPNLPLTKHGVTRPSVVAKGNQSCPSQSFGTRMGPTKHGQR